MKIVKIIRETIEKYLKINELDKDMNYNKVLWRHLIKAADSS